MIKIYINNFLLSSLKLNYRCDNPGQWLPIIAPLCSGTPTQLRWGTQLQIPYPRCQSVSLSVGFGQHWNNTQLATRRIYTTLSSFGINMYEWCQEAMPQRVYQTFETCVGYPFSIVCPTPISTPPPFYQQAG